MIAPRPGPEKTGFLRQFWQQYPDLVKKPLGTLRDRPFPTKKRSGQPRGDCPYHILWGDRHHHIQYITVGAVGLAWCARPVPLCCSEKSDRPFPNKNRPPPVPPPF